MGYAEQQEGQVEVSEEVLEQLVGSEAVASSGGSEAGACEDDDITVGDAVGVGGTARRKAGVSTADDVCSSSDDGETGVG